jgi:hypothetical protein
MLRQIVEDPAVMEELDLACAVAPRLREAWEGLKWLLARTPEIGHRLGLGETIRVHKQAGLYHQHLPAITVLYEFTDTTVFIRSVRFEYLYDR